MTLLTGSFYFLQTYHMPELPEVETIVRYLKPRLCGKRIVDISINEPRTIRGHKNAEEIKIGAVGKKIKNISRIGKNIIFELSNKKFLTFHLMMTGRLLLNPKKSLHDRMAIFLSGKTRLVFNDIRKFGRCRLLTRLNFAGVDALKISFSQFSRLLRGTRRKIKNFLLDQSVVSGVGNIYADEILWQAGVNPLRRANTLNGEEIAQIYSGMMLVLRRAIKKGGTTSRDYRKPDGTRGDYYSIRRVYQRAGEGCFKDGKAILKIKIGGRTTHFCPLHQK